MAKKILSKKLMIGIAFIIILLCIAILFLNKNNDDNVTVKDNVYVVSAETNAPIVVNDKELHFEENPGYKENDIIVSGITNHAPNGFVRKVINVDDNGNVVIIHTENAVLTDVFEEAHISKVFLLSDTEATEVNEDSLRETLDFDNTQTNAGAFELSDIIGVEQVYAESNDEYQFQKDFGYPLTENLDVEGNVGFNAWLQVDIDIEDEEILWTMALHTETGGEIFVGCRKGKEFPFEKELFTKDLPSIEFLAGEVPVVITNRIESILEGTLGFEGEIGTTVNLDSKSSTGFQYSSIDNKVIDISESEYLSDGIEWNTSASVQGDATVGVNLNLVSMLYDCTGASLGVGLEERNSAQLCLDPDTDIETATYFGRIDLSISPKIQGSIIVQSPVIDEELCSAELFDNPFNPLWEKSWESSDKWKTDFEKGMLKREWKGTYSLIIEDMQTQKTSAQIGIPSIYYLPTLEDKPEGRGGVATWFPNNNTEVLFFTKDISKEEPDGIPELFLGKKENGNIEIFAVFTYDKDAPYKCARVISSTDSYDPANSSKVVKLTKHDYIFEGTESGGRQILLSGTAEMPFPVDFELDPSAKGVLIDTNSLEWESLDKW